MLTFIFSILMIVIFGRLAIIAFKLTWGFTKVVFTLIFLPIALIIALINGLIGLAFPVLIVIGIISLLIV